MERIGAGAVTSGEVKTVGVVGTGRMGGAITRRLVSTGYEVLVHNRTRSKAATLADEFDLELVESPAAMARGVDVLLTSLTDGAAVEDVYRGDEGVLEGIGPHCTAVETSTIGPGLARRLGDEVHERGAGLLDAPISGRPTELGEGATTIIAGGRERDLQRVAPVLERLGHVVYAGASGAGAAMKLAVNTVVFGYLQAIVEGLVLAEAGGISRGRAYDIFLESAATSDFMRLRRPGFLRPGSVPVQVPLGGCRGIVDLIVQTATDLGVELPQTTRTARVVTDAAAAGYGNEDVTWLAVYLRGLAGLPPLEEERHG
jgi:3-hydroxyisobutyrate dehydrogenase-like beta-hydroxyacid dehydrogenase